MFHPGGWDGIMFPQRWDGITFHPRVGWCKIPQKMTASHVCQRRLLVYTIRSQIVTGLGFIVGLVLMS
jgi:hypothetical protein